MGQLSWSKVQPTLVLDSLDRRYAESESWLAAGPLIAWLTTGSGRKANWICACVEWECLGPVGWGARAEPPGRVRCLLVLVKGGKPDPVGVAHAVACRIHVPSRPTVALSDL